MICECEAEYIPLIGHAVYLTSNGKLNKIGNKYLGLIINTYRNSNNKYFAEIKD